MKDEVYNATNTSLYTAVSATAKSAIKGPVTHEMLTSIKTDLHALVTTGKISIKDNLHLYLGLPNPMQQIFPDGLARPIVLHDLDSLQLYAIKLS